MSKDTTMPRGIGAASGTASIAVGMAIPFILAILVLPLVLLGSIIESGDPTLGGILLSGVFILGGWGSLAYFGLEYIRYRNEYHLLDLHHSGEFEGELCPRCDEPIQDQHCILVVEPGGGLHPGTTIPSGVYHSRCGEAQRKED